MSRAKEQETDTTLARTSAQMDDKNSFVRVRRLVYEGGGVSQGGEVGEAAEAEE